MVDKVYTIILVVLVALWLIYLLIESHIKAKNAKKSKSTDLVRYDNRKDWTSSNSQEDHFDDYEIVE